MSNLYRIDDNCWECRFARDESTPPVSDDADPTDIEAHLFGERYEIIHLAREVIEQVGLKALASNAIAFEVPGAKSLKGRWRIEVIQPASGWMYNIKQWFPFFRTVRDRDIVEIQVSRETPGILSTLLDCIRKVDDVAQDVLQFPPCVIVRMPRIDYPAEETLAEKIKRRPFGDAWTAAAAEAHQRWEAQWMPEQRLRPSCRLVLNGGQIVLERLHGTAEELEEEEINKTTVMAYKEFVTEEYGDDALHNIEYRYGLSLDALIESGEPLLPEHVWLVNTGVGTIDQQDLEVLYTKLKWLRLAALATSSKRPLEAFFEDYSNCAGELALSTRALRGITRQLSAPTGGGASIKGLRLLLEGLAGNGAVTIGTLNVRTFMALAEILETPAEDLYKMFTGRRIEHLPSMSYHTMVDKLALQPLVDHKEPLPANSPPGCDARARSNKHARTVTKGCPIPPWTEGSLGNRAPTRANGAAA